MNFKNAARKLWNNDVEEEQVYSGPYLLKGAQMNILVRYPRQFSDVREYAEALMDGATLMVSFDAVDAAMKNRIFDYLNGVSYIIGATVSKVSENLLMYAPNHVEVDKEAAKRSSRSWLGR